MVKYKLKYIYSLLVVIATMITTATYAQQYPGGVSTGTTRGYKVDVYDGAYTSVDQFGVGGTVKSTPDQSGYTGTVTGAEYASIGGTWSDNYGVEYTGILEIPLTGNYVFSFAADDHISVFIDGTLRGVATHNSGTQTFAAYLDAGDHDIKVKFYERNGNETASLNFQTGPVGSGITAITPVDGRFVRTEGSKLSAWYKASNLNVTANYGGAGQHKVNEITNMAPDYTGNGSMTYHGHSSSNYATVQADNNLVNFNRAVRFDGDDHFRVNNANQKGLSFNQASVGMYLVADYTGNQGQSNEWLFYQGNVSGGTNPSNGSRIGLYKRNSTSTEFRPSATGTGLGAGTSAYTASEPKILGGVSEMGTGLSGVNNFGISINGTSGTKSAVVSNVKAGNFGLAFSAFNSFISTVLVPEAIYYPFELTVAQQQKVNTYLAIKYGTVLSHDYINTSGSVVYSHTANAGYTNRIFGIGRELAVEGLDQKQSQSQMTSAFGYDFLVASKGAIAVSNDANTGLLADGDYLIMGDNDGTLAPQDTELPASYVASSLCTVNRLGREWKVQVAGNPGAITVQAGGPASYRFPASATGLVLLIDEDGDGDFTTGSTTIVPATSVTVAGVATFDNVTFSTGDVFTFGWNVTSPGGVSTGLTYWYSAQRDVFSDNGATTAANDGDQVLRWKNQANAWNDLHRNTTFETSGTTRYYNSTNLVNFNPAVGFNNSVLFTELASNYTSNNTTAFLSVAPTQDADHRRWAFKRKNQNDWNNDNGIRLFANGYNGSGMALLHQMHTGRNGTKGNITDPVFGVPGVFSTIHTGTNTILFNNGLGAASTGYVLPAPDPDFMIMGGTRDGNNQEFTYKSSSLELYTEAVLYNRVLTDEERQRVETYLAIKNGTTLDISATATYGSQYLASDGVTNLYNYTAYAKGIFGIGRDDCSGLLQKQSQSTGGTDNVTIGLNTITPTNQNNTGAFANNLQFTMIGNDGGSIQSHISTNIPAAYISASCNAVRYARNWKVSNTGYSTSTPLQVKIGNTTYPVSVNHSNVTLAIDSDGDGDFSTGTPVLIAAANIAGGVATFNNVVLEEGAVFTLLYTLGSPGGVFQPLTGTDINGDKYVNGVAYKLYSSANIAGNNSLITNFADFIGTNAPLSTGYYNNIGLDIEDFFALKVANLFAMEATGKLYIPAAGNYTFRAQGTTDDRMSFVINGTTAVDVQVNTGSTTTGAPVNFPAAGYYDFVYRIQDNTGGDRFDLQWDGGTGAWASIPDANFFVQPQGPSAWYAANNGLLAVLPDGTQMTTANGNTWNDLSLNNNHIVAESNALAPDYYSTNPKFIINYNSVVDVVDDKMSLWGYANGMGYGKQGKTVLSVASMYKTTGQENLTGYGKDDGTNDMFRFLALGNNSLSLEGYNNGLTGGAAFYTDALTRRIDLLEGWYANGNITTANNAAIYTNGKMYNQGTKTPWRVPMNNSFELTVGNSPEANNSNGWNGSIGEVLYYPWDLSPTERHRVNSYLAVKWGLTLDQTTPTNYVNSSGDVIWNAAIAGIFNHDVTGIGRDDCGALMQKQSTSTDADDIVSVAKGSFTANNAQNTGEFVNDKDFLFVSHNNAGIHTTNTVNLPASMATSCYVKLDREWQVQTVGTPGNVAVQIGKNGLFNVNAANYKPVLLISNTAGDYTAATIIEAGSVYQGRATFDDVALANGQYFTVAYINAGPGGVTENMTTWFNADYDVFTDVEQATFAANDNDGVASINNLKFGSNMTKLQQVNSNYNPLYKPGIFNYNTGLFFDGTNDVLATSGSINTLDYRTTTQMTSVMATYNLGSGSQNVFWYHDDGNGTNKTSMERAVVFWNASSGTSRPTLTAPEIYTYTNTVGGAGVRLMSNLKPIGGGALANTGTVNGRFRIGSQSLSGSGNPARFYMGEFVIYSDDKGATTTNDMRRIHSYMAAKYGFTLDAASVDNAYVASDMTPTYSYTNYWNHITGIGRDDCSAFEQKQSFSQEITGALVKISNDPTGLAATNTANTTGFADDKTFLFFGDNGKDLKWNGTEAIPGGLVGLHRVWRVKENGTVNDVYLQVPSNSSVAATYKLPASATEGEPVYFVVSSTGDFSNPDAIIEMVPDAENNLFVTYNFNDGDYYTFASTVDCIGPAGINDGLTSWFKMDELADGTIAANTADALYDYSLSGNHLSRNPNGTATVSASEDYNFNRMVTLTGNAAFEKTGLNETSVTAQDKGHFFAVGGGNTNNSLFTLSRTGYFAAGITTTQALFANASDPAAFYSTDRVATDKANIWESFLNQSDNNMLGAVVNGYANYYQYGSSPTNDRSITANNTYGLRVGAGYYSGLTFNNDQFGEGFTFNRDLTYEERVKLNTYLSLKYGQTIITDYISPNGTVLYSHDYLNANATYGNRIFGVGHHIAGCFAQNQSKSVVTDALLTISVDGEIKTENSHDTSVWVDGAGEGVDEAYLIMGDNGDVFNVWNDTGATKPVQYATQNTCATWLSREWKVTTTKDVPELFIAVPDNTSVATTKLPALPANYLVYMLVNDTPDFETAGGNTVEVAMTFNETSKNWEGYYKFPADTTKYITFVARPTTCGRTYIITNPATATQQLKR